MDWNFYWNASKFYLSKYYAFVSNRMPAGFHEEIKMRTGRRRHIGIFCNHIFSADTVHNAEISFQGHQGRLSLCLVQHRPEYVGE